MGLTQKFINRMEVQAIMEHPVRMKGYNISGLYLCFVMGNNFFWLKTYEIAKPQKMLLAMKKVEDGDW